MKNLSKDDLIYIITYTCLSLISCEVREQDEFGICSAVICLMDSL